MLRKKIRVIAIPLDEQANSDHRGAWQIAEPSNDPEQELLEREMQFQIHQAVEGLPASLRTVMEAHRFQDRRLKELASMAGLTVAATKSGLTGRGSRFGTPFNGCGRNRLRSFTECVWRIPTRD